MLKLAVSRRGNYLGQCVPEISRKVWRP